MPILPIVDPARLPDVKPKPKPKPKPKRKPNREPQRPPKWIKGEDGWIYKNPEYTKYILSYCGLVTPKKRAKTSE